MIKNYYLQYTVLFNSGVEKTYTSDCERIEEVSRLKEKSIEFFKNGFLNKENSYVRIADGVLNIKHISAIITEVKEI